MRVPQRRVVHYNAYPSIVAGGANACILHYGENHDVLNDGEMLLIDAGAESLATMQPISRVHSRSTENSLVSRKHCTR